MIVTNILALLLPLILAPQHPETTRGPRATASCKYFTTPHPYCSDCYNRRMRGKYSEIVTTKNRKTSECNTRTSKEVTHPITTLDKLALPLPLILTPRHPETTHGPHDTVSYKYFTALHPYHSECYNRRMRGKYSRIVTTKNRKKGNATRGLPRRSPILVLLSPKHA